MYKDGRDLQSCQGQTPPNGALFHNVSCVHGSSRGIAPRRGRRAATSGSVHGSAGKECGTGSTSKQESRPTLSGESRPAHRSVSSRVRMLVPRTSTETQTDAVFSPVNRTMDPMSPPSCSSATSPAGHTEPEETRSAHSLAENKQAKTKSCQERASELCVRGRRSRACPR